VTDRDDLAAARAALQRVRDLCQQPYIAATGTRWVDLAELRRALDGAPDPGPDRAAPVKSALEEEGSSLKARIEALFHRLASFADTVRDEPGYLGTAHLLDGIVADFRDALALREVVTVDGIQAPFNAQNDAEAEAYRCGWADAQADERDRAAPAPPGGDQ
jgi:hypothetical protein